MKSKRDKVVQSSDAVCTNSRIGKFLTEFNSITFNQDFRMNPKNFQAMIDHFFVCRFCKKQLSFAGKEIVAAEMILGGYLLKGKAKTERKQYRVKLFKASPKQRIKLMEEMLTRFSGGEFTEELKKIDQFLQD